MNLLRIIAFHNAAHRPNSRNPRLLLTPGPTYAIMVI